jgi:TolA-binding protein/TM2 domain-containing membrane protein YozV
MQKFFNGLIFIIFVIFIISVPGSAPAAASDESSREKQFEFAEKLFQDGDLDRAITEYRRYIFLYPADTFSEKAYFSIGRCYFKAGKWEESVKAFKEFEERFPESPMTPGAYYFKGLSERHLKRFDDAISSFEYTIKSGSQDYRDKAMCQSALVLVDREDWEGALGMFSYIPDWSDLSGPARNFSAGLKNMDNISRKSPVLAGTLAAIIPGAGHLYTERPRDALIAFLLNGAFILAAVEFFDDKNYAAGSIAAFFEIGWYGGNIYSAVSSAHKFNRRTKKDFIESLKRKTGISYYRNPDNDCNYIMLSLTF